MNRLKALFHGGLFCFALLSLFFFVSVSLTGGDKPAGEKRLLVIYSFTINFAPDFQFMEAFNRQINRSDLKLRVVHLELDAFFPKNSTPEALDKRLQPYLPQIEKGEFDVIIPIGQIAVDLVQKHSKRIPEKTAVAFCGLDITTKELFESHANTTGSMGRISVVDNIELGLHFYPNAKRVVLLTDWSIQGQRILKYAKNFEQRFPGIQYVYPENLTTGLNDMLKQMSQYDSDTLILFYAWFNMDSTNLASLQYIMSHLERSKAPVFALQEPMLWDGAVGGVFSPVDQIGIALAERVERVLKGEKASAITIAAIPQQTVVPWNAIRSGRISRMQIPGGAKLTGKISFFRKENYPIIAVSGISLILLAGLLSLVSILFFRLRCVTTRTEAILKHIPEDVVVSDVNGRLLFLHSGNTICDNSSAKLSLSALPGFYNEKIEAVVRHVFEYGLPQKFEDDFNGRRRNIEMVKFAANIFGTDAVLWTINDIDDLYKMRRRLDEALKKSQLTLDSIGDAVIVTDEKAKITYLNPAARRMLDEKGASFTGVRLDECLRLYPENDEKFEKEFSLVNVIRDETAISQNDLILRLNNGVRKNIIFNLAPIKMECGMFLGAVIIFRDVTAMKDIQRKLEAAVNEAQCANRVKGLFLATMTHELRTPLNAVIGFTELLQSGAVPPEEQDEYIGNIHLASTTLLSLINDILDLSKIEAGQMVLSPRPLDVFKLGKELVTIFSQKAKEKGIGLMLKSLVSIPQLSVDELRLRQILLNLIGNAVKYTEKGKVELQFDFTPVSEESGDLMIHVIDTGVGVKPEARKKIFELFVQQDAKRDSSVYKGTGLGLAIAMRLAHLMGGTIELKSEENKGSDFTLVLHNVPVVRQDG